MLPALAMPLLLSAAVVQPAADAECSRQLTRDAIILCARALWQQRDDRLATAARQLEEAVRLDPQALGPRVVLVPLYDALGRPAEAERTAQAVLAMDAAQAGTARWLARRQLDQGRSAAATATLERSLAAPALADRPAELAQLWHALGEIRERLNRPSEAADAYRRGLAAVCDEHERGELLVALGRASHDRTAFDRAKAAFERADDSAAARRVDYHLAAMLAGQQRWADANAAIDRYLAHQPRDLPAYELKLQLARTDESAFETLERFFRRDPDYAPLAVMLAGEYRRRNDWPRAERIYLNIINREPDVAAYRGLLAGYADQSPDQAIALLERRLTRGTAGKPAPRDEHLRAMLAALAQEPDTARAILTAAGGNIGWRRSRRSSEYWRLMSDIAMRSNQAPAAEQLFRTVLFSGGPRVEYEAYDGLLRALEAQRDWPQVIQICRQGIETARMTSAELFHWHESYALQRLDRINEALAAADRAVAGARDMNLSAMLVRRIDILTYAERFTQAETEARAMFAKFHQPADLRRIRLALARVLAAANRWDDAEAQLRWLIQEQPEDAQAYNDLGYELADRGRKLPEAERLIRQALELDRREKKDSLEDDGESAAYLDSLGWVLFRRGRWTEARQLLERAAAMPSGAIDPVVWGHLGDVCYRLGDRKSAADAWTKERDLALLEKRSLHDRRATLVAEKLQRVMKGG